jgi:hypothetical protein
MAGRARTHALRDELVKRARAEFDTDTLEPDPSTLDYVCARIESGQTTKALAADITKSLPFECDYAMLMRHLRAEHGPDCDDAIDEARTRASHCLAEESLELVDACADTSVEVNRANSRSRSRQWLAQAWNPSKYGQQKGVSVNVSIGSLHLDALRAVPARATAIVTGSPEQHALPAGGAIVTTK